MSITEEFGAVSVNEYIGSVTLTDTALAEVEVLTEAAEAVDAAKAPDTLDGAEAPDILAAAAATEGRQLPVIKVLKGNPTDLEIAALVAVLAGAGSAEQPVDTTPPERWGAPTTMHRSRMPFSPYAFAHRA